MHEATRELLIQEAKADRNDLHDRKMRQVGDGAPCRICGALIEVSEGIAIHVEWHWRQIEPSLRVMPHEPY